MSLRSIDVRAAHTAMSEEKDFVFLDVRTPGEYAQGHPAGARNIPWALVDPRSGMMAANPEFVASVQAVAQSGQRIYVACQAGGRSMNACRDLAAAGFVDLVNVDGGFGGRRDPSGSVITGWRDAGLPTER